MSFVYEYPRPMVTTDIILFKKNIDTSTVSPAESFIIEDSVGIPVVGDMDLYGENAVGAKQTCQAGQDLAVMASDLQVLVSQFKV